MIINKIIPSVIRIIGWNVWILLVSKQPLKIHKVPKIFKVKNKIDNVVMKLWVPVNFIVEWTLPFWCDVQGRRTINSKVFLNSGVRRGMGRLHCNVNYGGTKRHSQSQYILLLKSFRTVFLSLLVQIVLNKGS